jgi:hypothetical protein
MRRPAISINCFMFSPVASGDETGFPVFLLPAADEAAV